MRPTENPVRLLHRLTALTTTTIASLSITAVPAAAQTIPQGCSTAGLGPLFNLLATMSELLFAAGIGLGGIGFLVAGIYVTLPGQDNTRRGKDVAKHVLFGLILILSADLIVQFLVSQLGGIC